MTTSMNVTMILTDVITMHIVEILSAVTNVDVELDLMVMVTSASMRMNVFQAWFLGPKYCKYGPVPATIIKGHNECPQHSQCTNLDEEGYSCWCEEGYEYISHKIDLDATDGSVIGTLPLRDRLVCIDIDECITIHPCQGEGLYSETDNIASIR